MIKQKDFAKNERGQAMTEYAIIASVFAVWIVSVHQLMVNALNVYLKSIYFVLSIPLP